MEQYDVIVNQPVVIDNVNMKYFLNVYDHNVLALLIISVKGFDKMNITQKNQDNKLF